MRKGPGSHSPVGSFNELTTKQREVARLLVLGYTCAEIGKLLEISVKTVDTHRAAVLYRMSARNPVALVRRAIREGFTTADATDEPKDVA
jgi:DNA-binding NarL/FixJ family response regulator